MRISMIFAFILALKTPPKSGVHSTFCWHFPQDTSKMPPRRPKMPPRHLQDAPKTLQEASKTALRPPKTSPRRLWTAQRRLQVASDCSETLQRVLQDWKIRRAKLWLGWVVHCRSGGALPPSVKNYQKRMFFFPRNFFHVTFLLPWFGGWFFRCHCGRDHRFLYCCRHGRNKVVNHVS